jgi:serine/threonine protein kinase
MKESAMPAPAPVHPSDQTLQSYGLGKLDDLLAEAVVKHLKECDSCRRRVAEVTSDSFVGRLRDAQARPESIPPVGSSLAGLSKPDGEPRTPAPPPASTLPPGLAEHPDYQVLRELGRGGMGVVYLAENRLMGRKEVLKVVSSHLLDRKGVLERFLREIRSAAQLHHPNIVTAYSATRVGESIVFAMQYVDGYDLAKLVEKSGPLSVAHACNFVYQAALGLQHAHEHGMVHRDIKPSNLMLARDGNKPVVKVLDFGLAKVTSEGAVDGGLTYEGQMLGTPHYVAPEQTVSAQKADIRADIYSLGCTLYCLLTGHPPFDAPSLYELLQAHHSMYAKPLNFIRPEVPAELAAVVAKMLAKEPERRFQTPAEVAQALTRFFKKGNVASTGSKPELSQAGRPDAKQATAGAGSVPVRPAAALAPAPAPPVGKPVDPPRPEAMWKSLVDFKETEPVKKAAPAAASNRRPPWLWPAVAVGVLLLGFVAVWGVLIRNWTPEGFIAAKRAGNMPAQVQANDLGGKGAVHAGVVGRPDAGPAVKNPQESIENSIGMKLKRIPAGTFQMGSPDGTGDENEHPQHEVRITRPFYLGVTEVTQAQYEAVMGNNPSFFSATGNGMDNVAGQSTGQHPVETVSWFDAVKFCNKLSELEGRKPFYEIDGETVRVPDWKALGYRLPTEAEWEYACAGDPAHLEKHAWFDRNSGRVPHPVGKKLTNRFGLHDMHGNVWEWCWDAYDKDYYKQSPRDDPTGPDASARRVIRGGSWGNDARYLRAAYRYLIEPSLRGHDLGFRCALVSPA